MCQDWIFYVFKAAAVGQCFSSVGVLLLFYNKIHLILAPLSGPRLNWSDLELAQFPPISIRS